MIYLDNAATSWPKPEEVYHAVDKALRECGGNPGRGNHSMSLAAKEQVYVARMLCASLFHVSKPECICFALNTTEALNLAIKGVLTPGDHVVTGSMEHNSIARPLKKLESSGIQSTKVATSPETGIDLVELEKTLEEKPKLMICSHISNVTGTINPIKEIGALCKKYGVLFLIDAAQSAGMKKISVEENNIDMLAFPGHKGLFGPQGTGGLYIRDGLILGTLIEGGTGIHSEKYDQPEQKPERYESGTQNLPGIAGMAAGIKYIMQEKIENIENKEIELTNQLLNGLSNMNNITIYGPKAGKPRGNVVSFTIEGMDPNEVAIMLDSVFQIAVRSGLHCARDTHETIGTLDKGGTVRVSPNCFNSKHDIEKCIDAIRSISQGV